MREAVRAKCQAICDQVDKSRPMTKDEMEVEVRTILEELELPEGYLGWTMVMFASEFWREQVAAVPPNRRLFLLSLPQARRRLPADDQFGLDCKTCGACSIADFGGWPKIWATECWSQGLPIVHKIIVSGYVDAIVGVACLNVLEKAIDKIFSPGFPAWRYPALRRLSEYSSRRDWPMK